MTGNYRVYNVRCRIITREIANSFITVYAFYRKKTTKCFSFYFLDFFENLIKQENRYLTIYRRLSLNSEH